MTGYPVDVAALAEELAPLLAERLAPPRPLLSAKEVGERLGISERTVRDMIGAGKLPSFRVEGSRRVDPADVDAYVAAQRQAESEVADETAA